MVKACDSLSLPLALLFVLGASIYNLHELCILSAVCAGVCTFLIAPDFMGSFPKILSHCFPGDGHPGFGLSSATN